MFNIFSKLLDVNQREVDRLSKTVEKINEHEVKLKTLKESDFSKKTEDFKKKIEAGSVLEEILPESFAMAREAGVRTLGKRLFDVQLMAAIALFEGKIAEQKTGEGKTLSAVPALYLRALSGKGAHLVTVNDYLARRDAGWNAPIFRLLGLSVGAIAQEMKSYVYDPEFSDSSHGDERLAHLKPSSRKESYACDITYGTNNEFGFDYLRDNMVQSLNEMSQRGHYFAIVDEVDSILIDEARTPLIISAPDTEPTKKYYEFARLVEQLNPDTDYTIDEKMKSATLTEHGISRVEKTMGVDNLYEKDFDSIHHIENALRARTLYLKDREYVVKDDAVTIVDEFTGRLMFGRRWSDGLHQAVEAKEGVTIQQESKTLATISFQNYFRMYEHLSGMTGTAATEAEEFRKIYKTDVVVIPTNKKMIRIDASDVIYKTLRGKYGAIVSEIEQRHKKGQPVLVGTTSIEKNEIIDEYLKRKKIPHNVLNAKNHEREASIIADAGKPGAVTVATNMAGRGVDIVLGGAQPDKPADITNEKWSKAKEIKRWQELHDEVIKAGGLHVVGTERHESRRIDNQLRGRSGRQGDPGSSRFYLSLEDDLMRIFGGDQIISLMDRFKLPEDQPIENSFISKAIEGAQSKVEGFHFDARKHLVEYDDVKNQQREIVYKLRREVLESKNLEEKVKDKLEKELNNIVFFSKSADDGKLDVEKAVVGLLEIVPFDEGNRSALKGQIQKGKSDDEIVDFLRKVVMDVFDNRKKELGEQVFTQIEKFAYLSSIDHMWIEHLDATDAFEDAVKLRGYAQKDPLSEFKNEAFSMFEGLLSKIDTEVTRRLFRIGVMQAPTVPLAQARTNVDQLDATGLAPYGENMTAKKGELAFAKTANESVLTKVSNSDNQSEKGKGKLGRNDPCWCGSGKKWKKCHYPQAG
ncbi:MAG: Protein translocase subunit SecA [Candidatus Woesebacteria bacterium GW2011_GWA1_39_21]|uniref:Protein translocase subunit SecA n=1 Tax=Candidatus Woesebacteria bacterium GW2011_GWA1_39_21 TaxID=1618550 RepID=A0A0G0QL90_9BACT|nr:MAG: Protein translocase subunit SecA [Candidatus Woesebacteria bacterium GW2011_GWA1_39_21]